MAILCCIFDCITYLEVAALDYRSDRIILKPIKYAINVVWHHEAEIWNDLVSPKLDVLFRIDHVFYD